MNPRRYCISLILLSCLPGCEDRAIAPAAQQNPVSRQNTAPKYIAPGNITQSDMVALDILALNKVIKPDCVLDVEPGKIKKCKPELKPETLGISGQLQIDGIRPDSNWTPMVAIELSSKDERHKLRIKFNITHYQTDPEGNPNLSETTFKGVVERWTDQNKDWFVELPVEITPTQAFDFVLLWKPDQSLDLQLGTKVWQAAPLGFEVDYALVMGSGVLVATANFTELRK